MKPLNNPQAKARFRKKECFVCRNEAMSIWKNAILSVFIHEKFILLLTKYQSLIFSKANFCLFLTARFQLISGDMAQR